MHHSILASLLLASAGSLALAAPTFNPKSVTGTFAPSPSDRARVDSLPFADAHERRAWSRHLAKRQVAVPNVAAVPVIASPAVAVPVAATAAVVDTPNQPVVPTVVVPAVDPDPATATPLAATLAAQSVNVPVSAAVTTTAAAAPLKNRPVASSSAVLPDPVTSNSADAPSAPPNSLSASASSSTVAAPSSASSSLQSSSSSALSPSATASSAPDSSNGNIFSPSSHLFIVGILVIIGIIVLSILSVIYIVKRLAHSPRYADERDYPDGFPRDFLDDKAVSKRWSHTSQAGLLWEDGAKVPSSSAGEANEVREKERAAQGAVGREFGGQREGGPSPLPPVEEEQAPPARWTTFTNGPEPVPLAGRVATVARPTPPFTPRPSSALPLRPAPRPPRISSAAPSVPPKPTPVLPPSVRQPNKLVRASTNAAPTVVGDAHTLQKHRFSPRRESALRNEVY